MKHSLTIVIFMSLMLFASAAAAAQITAKPAPDASKTSQITAKPAPDAVKIAQPVAKPTPDASNALLQQTILMQRFAVEMTRLKLEVTELKIELQQTKVAGLENDLRQVQTGKRNLETHRVEFRPETAQNSQQANLTSQRTEPRAEIVLVKTLSAEKTPERLRAEEQHLQLAKREVELSGQLKLERAHLQELKEQLDKLNRLCEVMASNSH